MRLEAKVRNTIGDLRIAQASGRDYDAAKAAVDALVSDDEQVLAYRRLED